jgi:DNA-binding NarL/FixJ family response regulator
VSARPIRVVLADDHALVREGSAELLERAGEIQVVGQAATGPEALELVAQQRPDVLVLDLSLPGMDGIEVCRRAKAAVPALAVLILTAHEERPYVLAALESGANGYLTKAARGREVIDAVRAVAAGQVAISPRVASAVVGQALDRHAAPAGTTLTPREIEVLRAVAQGLGNKQVAALLGLSERTVQTHLTHIFAKLGVGSRTEAVLTAVRQGWVHPELREGS